MTDPRPSPWLPRVQRGVVLAATVGIPLAAWPDIEQPFSTPKLWLLGVASASLIVTSALCGTLLPRLHSLGAAFRWAAGLWSLSFVVAALVAPWGALDALLLGLAGPTWCIAVVASDTPRQHVVASLAVAATIVSGVTLGQWAGFDPFRLIGWTPVVDGASARLRMYGTFGNPNFVAAWLGAAVPMWVAACAAWPPTVRTRRIAMGMLVMVAIAALAATGSRGGAAGLATGLAALAIGASARRRRALLFGATVIALIGLPLLSTGRPVFEAWEGRLHIWQTSMAHVFEAPWGGTGPGTFELQYDGWNRTSGRDAARFAGPQQHAHNDYLEAAIERGVLGLVATTLPIAVVAVVVWRRRRSLDWMAGGAGPAATILAVCAVAAIDFPLARPAEITLVWTAVALLETNTPSARHRDGVVA